MMWKKFLCDGGVYEVSDTGEVRSLRRSEPKTLKQRLFAKGYSAVTIGAKPRLVHRLVMLCFRGHSELHVNHKNGIKTDNRLENLEWVTPAENNLHAFRVLKRKPVAVSGAEHPRSKKVGQYALDGALIKVWDSAGDAGRQGFQRAKVTAVCLGSRKSHAGFVWRYLSK